MSKIVGWERTLYVTPVTKKNLKKAQKTRSAHLKQNIAIALHAEQRLMISIAPNA